MNEITPTDDTGYYASLRSNPDVKSVVSNTATKFGISDKDMLAIGMVESGLNPKAQASTSSAKGTFQFTEGTWNEVIKTHGPTYGIPDGTSRDDHAANSILAGAYLKQNAESYTKAFGNPPNSSELYLGHFLGAGGRNKFIRNLHENPNAPASSAVGEAQYNANRSIFENRTIKEVYDHFKEKLTAHGSLSPAEDKAMASIKEGINQKNNPEVPEALKDYKPENPEFGLDINKGSAPKALDSKSFVQEVVEIKEAEKEKGVFDGTWAAVKGEWNLSSIGSGFVANEQRYDSTKLSPEARAIGELVGDVDKKEYTIPDFMKPKKDASHYVMNNFLGTTDEHESDTEQTGLTFTPEMFTKITETGLTEEWFPYLQASKTANELAANIDKALALQQADKDRKGAGWGGQLVGGVVGALGDPLTYTPVGMGASIGARVAVQAGIGAVAGGVDELRLESFTQGAIDGEYMNAMVGGAIAGGAFSFAGDMVGMAIRNRMVARKAAQEAGEELDPTLHPTYRNEDINAYIDHPTESGAVVMGDGTIMSPMNPMNPKTLAKVQEAMDLEFKSSAAFKPFRDIADISVSVFSSKSNEVRGLGADLIRSSVGMKTGGSGKQGMVADDILQLQNGRDNLTYKKLDKALSDAEETGYFAFNKEATKETAHRQIVEAVESGDLSKLTPAQRKVVPIITESMEAKFKAADNPSIFGRSDAPSVFDSKRDPKNYFPQVFEEGKRLAVIERLGGKDNLKASIVSNWKAQVKADHKGSQKVFQEMFKDQLAENPKLKLDDLIDDYIEKKAYGIAHSGDFTTTKGIADEGVYAGSGKGASDFTKERNIFDSSFKTHATDGSEFAINDLRHFDIMNTMDMYNKRMNGDIAIHGGTGKSTTAFSQAIDALEDSVGKKDLQEVMKMLTGQSRRVDPAGKGQMWANTMRDLAFATRGTLMWTNQLGEAAGYTSNRIMTLLRNSDDTLDKLMNRRSKFSKADMDDFHASMFGEEFNDAIAPSFRGLKESLTEQGTSNGVANVTAGFRKAAQVMARKSPFTKLLTKSTSMMVDMARKGTLGDVASDAMTGRTAFTPAMLKAADITPAQYDGIKTMMKEHLTKGADGKLSVNTKAVLDDPRSLDLWRLADFVASDTVFRTARVGQGWTRQPSALMGLALQFKAFMLKGINGRFMKMMNEYGKGRGLDHTLHMIMGVGMSGSVYAMRSHMTAWGMAEEKRDAYLEKALDPSTIAFNAFSRSSTLGIPLGAIGLVGPDFAKMGRSTLTPERFAEKDKLAVKGTSNHELMGAAGKMVADAFPSAGVAASMVGTGKNLFDLATSDDGYESHEHTKALMGNLRGWLPNDPLTQRAITALAEEFGVYDK